jgi:hypothetical protein
MSKSAAIDVDFPAIRAEHVDCSMGNRDFATNACHAAGFAETLA